MPKAWQSRFERIRIFAWVAAVGFGFLLCALMTTEVARTFCIVSGVILLLPAAIYVYVMVILHWKDRYRGRHSDLWGALILIETSGWMKIVYLFRHMVPDMRQTGRYRPAA
jgi:hypothetical protein